MPTDYELALQAGGLGAEETDYEKSLRAGGQLGEEPAYVPPGAYSNRAVAEALGLGVWGEDVEALLGYTGMQFPPPRREPETPADYAARAVGQVASLALPMGAVTKAAAARPAVVGVTKLTTRIAQSVWEGIMKHPKASIATEVLGGAGAGAGRYIGEKKYPDRPLVRPLIEIGGGVAGGMIPTAAIYTPSAIGLRTGKKYLKKALLPFTKKGAKYRAGEYIKEQVADPQAAIAELERGGIGKLPPAVASGERRLMALYAQLRETNARTEREAIESLGASIEILEMELRSQGYGSTDALHLVTSKRIEALEAVMDDRVLRATGRAQTKLDAIPVAQRQSREAMIVKNELEAVRESADRQVKEIWGAVDKNMQVQYTNSVEKYASILSDTPIAQRGDIPEILRSSFTVKREEGEATVALAKGLIRGKGVSNIREMQGLRSKLLEDARIARANKQHNKARIAGEMADAILDDMTRAGGQSADLDLALAATRQYHERFSEGVVGKIFGSVKEGTPKIAPELILHESVGRGGLRGAVDLEKITITPEAKAAVHRYLARSFTDFSLDSAGVINPVKAQRWMRNNQDILDQYPQLLKQLTDADEAQKFATMTKNRMDARIARIRDPKISVAGQFLKSKPEKAINDVLNEPNAIGKMGQLVRQARKDPTGEAEEGLRGAFVDLILDKSFKGGFSPSGERTLSGGALLNFVQKNRLVLKQVFKPEQIKRMEMIGKDLAKIERLGVAGKEGIKMENMLQTGSRVGGAMFGRWFGRAMGSGGTVQVPGIFSTRFEKLIGRFTKDRASQLIHDAIISDSPDLLKALLLPMDKPKVSGKNGVEIIRAINLWLASTGSRVMEDIEEEISSEQMQLLQQQEGKTTLQ